MLQIDDIINLIRDEAHAKRCLGIRVFVSFTFVDLHEERLAVKKAIETCECQARLAENAAMLPGSPLLDQISYWLRDVDVLVLLVADRYGSLSTSKKSWTEEEVRKAVELPIRLLPYFVSRDLPRGIEFDEEKQKQLNDFKDFLNTLSEREPVLAQYPQYANDITDLSIRVSRDIGAIQSDLLIAGVIGRVLKSAQTTIQDQPKEQAYEEEKGFIRQTRAQHPKEYRFLFSVRLCGFRTARKRPDFKEPGTLSVTTRIREEAPVHPHRQSSCRSRTQSPDEPEKDRRESYFDSFID